MKEQTRFLNHASTEAERQVALAAEVGPLPLQRDTWDDIMARAVARPPESPWKLVCAFAVSLAIGAALVLVLRPPVSVQPARAAALVASADAQWKQLAPDEVSLQAGRMAIVRPGERKLRIVTPDATLETSHSRFLAEVTSSGTTVLVEQGEVVVRTRHKAHVVHAGESFTWPQPVEIPQHLLEAPSAGSSCASSTPSLQLECLEAQARGDSLEAQAATYELGAALALAHRGADAIERWRSSLTRFPGGVLEPEARIALLVELVRARRFKEAISEARAFEFAYPSDPRAVDVKRLRLSLEE